MPNITATNTYPARSFSEPAPGRAPSPANVSTAIRTRSDTDPQTQTREVQDAIHRDQALERYGSKPVSSQSLSREIAEGGILHQMRTICAPAQALEWKPVPGVTETLCALAQYAQGATEVEKQTIGAMLDDILIKTRGSHRDRDIVILKMAIDVALRGEDAVQGLAEFAEASLNLDSFEIRVEGLEEPPAQHFDSTLLPFAGASYNYGPLGRTLMFEGAREIFNGPSQAQRTGILRDYIFSVHDLPESPEAPIYECDIIYALFDLGIDVGIPEKFQHA